MKSSRYLLVLAVALLCSQFAHKAEAASPEITTIHVKDMHCENCARKIARKLFAVQGVVKVQASVKQDLVLVTPQAGKTISARAIWEAVIAGEAEPTKLVGPTGSFTAKPKS
jgi:copper chaperone CopZ